MFYDFPLLIPANTTPVKPVSMDCTICPGVIDRVMFIFPPGAAGLAHVRVARGGHQLWPSNLDGSFASDGEFLDFTESYSLDETPYTLLFSGWNLDDTYSHTITLRLGITQPQSKAKPGLVDSLRASLGLS